MKSLILFLSLSFLALGCDHRSPEQVRRDNATATKQAVFEQELDNKRRLKIVECDHKFEHIGSAWTQSKIMCPKCGIDQRDWEDGSF